jgi:hypothetical protein
MTVTLDSKPVTGRAETDASGSVSAPRGPATIAATRISRAGLLLGALGLASSLFVVVRLIETWRVTPTTSHRISIAGQTLSYPAANLGALVVVVLAMLGLAVTVLAILGALRELGAAHRFARRIAAERPVAVDEVLVIVDERPHAFCAGLLRPRVYVSSGAVAKLDHETLQAVVAHERHHARRGDPLRLAAGRVLARSLFFLPGIHQLVARQQALAELSADESAVNAAPANRSGLARAMLTFSDASPSDNHGVDPARVDHLLGEPVSWRFPTLLCLAAVSVVAVLVAITVLAGRVAAGSSTLAPPFLSDQPCVVVLALIPAAVGLMAFHARRPLWLGPGPRLGE